MCACVCVCVGGGGKIFKKGVNVRKLEIDNLG